MLIPGVDAVAAPVFDGRGKLVAVICVVGRSNGMPNDWGEPVVLAASRNPSWRERLRAAWSSACTTEPARDQTKKRIQSPNAT